MVFCLDSSASSGSLKSVSWNDFLRCSDVTNNHQTSMKNILMLVGSVLLLASCSAPKYSYYFDHYDYNSGKKKTNPETVLLAAKEDGAQKTTTEESPLQLEKETLIADAAGTVVVPEKPAPVAEKKLIEKKYRDLSKSEKKEFRKVLKAEIKKVVKNKKDGDSVNDTKVMDYNLKMAIIFGAVALTLSFFGGVNSVFWVASVVALVIGVVFFIKWIAEQ